MLLSPKFGLILSGLTGVGKSTLQEALLANGCWTPLLLTSRKVEPSEGQAIKHVSREELLGQIKSGIVAAPVIFGDNLYGWPTNDFERIRNEPQGCIIATRPYTALLLAASIPRLIPVWLDLREEVRLERLHKRAAPRDLNPRISMLRLARDAEDADYRELFEICVPADHHAQGTLSQFIERGLADRGRAR
jgi:guanylate kinase